MRPSRTTDLRDYDCDPISATICFPSDGNGQLVVFTREAIPNGLAVPRTPAKGKLAETDEAQDAKAAGRKVSKSQRQVTLFLDPETLEEKARWVHDRRGTENLDSSLFYFPAAKTAIQFGDDGVLLLDDATGEEYGRFPVELATPRNPRGEGLGMPGISRTNGSKCLIAAGHVEQPERNMDAFGRSKSARSIEVIHAGLSGIPAVSPMGNAVALSARSAWYPYGGRIPNPLDMDGPDIGTVELWQAESGKISRSFVGHNTPIIDCLKFLRDGKRLAALSYESPYALTASLIVWNVATGEVVVRRAFKDHPNRMQLSKDGSTSCDLEPHSWLRR